jgi:hypothetical protein
MLVCVRVRHRDSYLAKLDYYSGEDYEDCDPASWADAISAAAHCKAVQAFMKNVILDDDTVVELSIDRDSSISGAAH